jgi:endonuclease/exonuclease/phosphatase (EEP) superfamily protein YafD
VRAARRLSDAMSPRSLAAAVVRLAVAGVALATAMAIAPLPWPFSLVEHFHVQCLVAGAVLLPLAIGVGAARAADVAAMAALINLIVVAPHLRAAPTVAVDGAPLRVLVLNVHTASTAHDRVRALLDEIDADVVALLEIDRRWLSALAPSLTRYAGHIEEPRDDNFGIALYARRPLAAARIDMQGGFLPTIVARLDSGVSIVVTHPIPPVSAETARDNARHLAAVGDLAASLAGPRIVVGDFNATPWSRPFAALVARSGLRDSRLGFGVQASFPAAGGWLTALRIPIDHALVSPDIAVTARRVERDVGSDHLPVVLDLAIPRLARRASP